MLIYDAAIQQFNLFFIHSTSIQQQPTQSPHRANKTQHNCSLPSTLPSRTGQSLYTLTETSKTPRRMDTTTTSINSTMVSALCSSDPQPRDPGNGNRSGRPGQPKPIQPRDDGSSRRPATSSIRRNGRGPPPPQPRDPGNGRVGVVGIPLLANNASDFMTCPAPPRDPKDPQPRDGGKKKSFRYAVQPRDSGMRP